jgi:hypothetical protein
MDIEYRSRLVAPLLALKDAGGGGLRSLLLPELPREGLPGRLPRAGAPRNAVGIQIHAGRTAQPILQQLGNAVACGRFCLERHRGGVGDDVGDPDGDDPQRQPGAEGPSVRKSTLRNRISLG